MKGYNHILVAADLAADHEKILPRAAEIARAFGSKLTLAARRRRARRGR